MNEIGVELVEFYTTNFLDNYNSIEGDMSISILLEIYEGIWDTYCVLEGEMVSFYFLEVINYLQQKGIGMNKVFLLSILFLGGVTLFVFGTITYILRAA